MYCLHYGSEMFGPGENVMLVCYIHYNLNHDDEMILDLTNAGHRPTHDIVTKGNRIQTSSRLHKRNLSIAVKVRKKGKIMNQYN